jgi:uracil-DNA glycosylase
MKAEHMKIMFAGLTEGSKDIFARKLSGPLSKAIVDVNADIAKICPTDPLSVLTPKPELIFEAVRRCPVEKVRVVLIGQDPYIKPGEAQGMSFSVPKDFNVPPSLKNIYKCLHHSGLIKAIPTTGDLSSWASQGVLLLNCALTTQLRKSNAHADHWAPYTNAVIRALSDITRPLIFILFGGFAQEKKEFIDCRRHIVFEWGHPSNLNRVNGEDNNPKNFKYCTAFKQTNEQLALLGGLPINWDPTTEPPKITPLGFREVGNGCELPVLGTTDEVVSRYNPHTTVVDVECIDMKVAGDNTNTVNTSTTYTSNTSLIPATVPIVSGGIFAGMYDVGIATANTTANAGTNTVEPIIGLTQQHAPFVLRDWTDQDPQCYTNDTIWIFTDGGSSANGKANCKAAYGWYITDGEKVAFSSGLVPEVSLGLVYKASNNRGELTAILSAVEFMESRLELDEFCGSKIIVVSDSEYSINSITVWIYNWERDMTKHADKKNLDLIQPAKNLVERLKKKYKVEFRHMNSHQDEPADNDCEEWFMWKCNDIVDKLCNKTLGRKV